MAEELAQRSSWGRMYDPLVLAVNTVQCAATAYVEDMYVDCNLAQETAQGVRGLRLWMTNEYGHGGIREDGPLVFSRLLAMARDESPEW